MKTFLHILVKSTIITAVAVVCYYIYMSVIGKWYTIIDNGWLNCKTKKPIAKQLVSLFSTPRHRNIEPLGGLQKGSEIHRWQLWMAQPFDGKYYQ